MSHNWECVIDTVSKQPKVLRELLIISLNIGCPTNTGHPLGQILVYRDTKTPQDRHLCKYRSIIITSVLLFEITNSSILTGNLAELESHKETDQLNKTNICGAIHEITDNHMLVTCLHVFQCGSELVVVKQVDCLQIVECLKIDSKLVDVSLARVVESPCSVQ